MPVLANPSTSNMSCMSNEDGEARESTQPLPTVEWGYSQSQLETGHSRGGGLLYESIYNENYF